MALALMCVVLYTHAMNFVNLNMFYVTILPAL
jgi:hypothetical protein